MKRYLSVVGMALCLGALLLTSCERKQDVQAGGEPNVANRDYQPRVVPEPVVKNDTSPNIRGELNSIDMSKKTMVIRVENGMAQTFTWDNDTIVMGVMADTSKSKTVPDTKAYMKQLSGAKGSEVSVQWREDNGEKMAASINVVNMATPKKATSAKRRFGWMR